MKYGQKNEKDMKSSVYTVGLTGGIGSGKTTLAKMLEEKGAAVYYADTRAKEMMDADHVLVENIKDLLGPRLTGTADWNGLCGREGVLG